MKKALIILDVQEDFLRNTLDYIAPLCQKYLNNHGDEYDAIVLTHFVYEYVQGSETLLLSHPKAKVVGKKTYSGLTDEVKKYLEDNGIEELHIAGVDAEMAVLATMYAGIDAGYDVKILERLIGSYHGRNWESMMVARHTVGSENVLNIGGDRVWV